MIPASIPPIRDLAGKTTAVSTDPNGHGTAMAGIIAAGVDNGTGIAGVAYDGVTVMPVTVMGADGIGYDSDIIDGHHTRSPTAPTSSSWPSAALASQWPSRMRSNYASGGTA